ncbi:hypothetical protein JAO73_14355 [Hymenobacter sp. BT523]|uniref:hypothetical protein n=1 Tax=Hymenobacter sp. BT523 TaxID=2795725 RepID=UPI0018EAA208|nr:hypothetical protein [Hymenobacter sp. BT523]MBJ6110201.1 hypothetical protein [Hymenobacter sp. BT523]
MVNLSSLLPAVLVRTLVVLLLLAFHLPAAGQAPAWQSARAVAVATAAVSGNYSIVKATAVDAAGNVYLTGDFQNTVVLGGTTLTSLGITDVFIAKFNPFSNQFIWAQRAGGTGRDICSALVVSGTSMYVAGSFSSPTASFGTTMLTNAGTGSTAGTFDVFVAKLTDAGPTGSFVWAQQVGGADLDVANGLAVSGVSIYVSGDFGSRTAAFGASTLTNAGFSTRSWPSSRTLVAPAVSCGRNGPVAQVTTMPTRWP